MDKIRKILMKSDKSMLMRIIAGIVASLGAAILLGGHNSFRDSYSVELVILLLAVPMVYLYKKINRIDFVCILFSIILATILIIGRQIDGEGYLCGILWNFFSIIASSFLIYPIVTIVMDWILRIRLKPAKKIKTIQKTSLWLLFVAVIGVVWLAFWPGVFGYDAVPQVRQFETGSIGTHYSVIYSYLLYFFTMKIGVALFESANTGVACFSLIQMLFLSYVYCEIAWTAFRKGGKKCFVLTVMFLLVNPAIHLLSVSMCQDALFGGIFALLFMKLVQLVNSPAKFMRSKKNWFIVIIEVLCLCAIRNNGLYIVLFCAVFVALTMKSYRKSSLLLFIPAVMWMIVSGPINSLMGVNLQSDAICEMLSIPSQQLARSYVYNRDAWTDDDIERLGVYYDDIEKFEMYRNDPGVADGRKGRLKKDALKRDMLGYIKLWATIGVRDAKNYIEAALLTNVALWYPDKSYYDPRMYHPLIETESDGNSTEQIGVFDDSKLPIYRKIIKGMLGRSHSYYQMIPVARTLIAPGVYFVVTIFTVAVCVMNKKIKYMGAISLIIGLMATILLAPVALFRYIFPAIIVTPLAFLCSLKKEKRARSV